MTLGGKTVKVSYGSVGAVFDYDGSMYDTKTKKYTNILGLGSHAEKTCTGSKRDLLSDYTKAAKLPALFSLRSVSGTAGGAGRLYIGGSEDVWDGVETFAPLLVDEKGHYVLHLSGFEISSGQSKSQPVKLSKVTEVILDSGTSTSMVVSSNMMQSLLKALKVVCDGDWVPGKPLPVHTSADYVYVYNDDYLVLYACLLPCLVFVRTYLFSLCAYFVFLTDYTGEPIGCRTFVSTAPMSSTQYQLVQTENYLFIWLYQNAAAPRDKLR